MVSFPTREQSTGGVLAFPSPRRVRETPKAAAAYAAYEQMDEPRSYARLAKVLGKPSGYTRQLEHWASLFSWQKRLLEYEEKQLELRRKKRQDEIEKMDERHATFGRSSLFSVMQYMQDHFAQEATLPDAIRLMKVAYELERLARGAATSKVDADVKVGVLLPKEYINIREDEWGSEP